ncbi:putative sterol 24-C-methyltransferase [Helianthus annuus]|nr:putative sterol 24-C-methyltransferase [Helianthus annuus]
MIFNTCMRSIILILAVQRKIERLTTLTCAKDYIHLICRWKGESLRESIKQHEHFLALQLGLKPGHKVLDVGCGIGGLLRKISRFR